jgi:hypothetical protein
MEEQKVMENKQIKKESNTKFYVINNQLFNDCGDTLSEAHIIRDNFEIKLTNESIKDKNVNLTITVFKHEIHIDRSLSLG